MSRKDDLERSIRESYDLINQYEAIRRESSDPKAMARARQYVRGRERDQQRPDGGVEGDVVLGGKVDGDKTLS